MARHRFERKSEIKEQPPRILIVSEGLVTEEQYLNAIKATRRIRSAQILLMPPPPTSPIEMVQKAKEEQRKAERSDPYDSVWCVFDVEAKVNQRFRYGLHEALALANEEPKVGVAFSNPCFELWILLHEEHGEAWVSSDTVQTRCKTLRLIDGKHLVDPETLVSKCANACESAKRLKVKHDRDGTHEPEDKNPFSAMYLLIEEIESKFPKR